MAYFELSEKDRLALSARLINCGMVQRTRTVLYEAHYHDYVTGDWRRPGGSTSYGPNLSQR